MTGSLPSGLLTPAIVIGRSAVPRAEIISFSRYGSLRQWIRTVSPGASVIQGTDARDSQTLPGPTSYVAAPALLQASARVSISSISHEFLIIQLPPPIHYALSRQRSPTTAIGPSSEGHSGPI